MKVEKVPFITQSIIDKKTNIFSCTRCCSGKAKFHTHSSLNNNSQNSFILSYLYTESTNITYNFRVLQVADIPTKSGLPLLQITDIPTKSGSPLLFVKDIPTKSGSPLLFVKDIPTKSGLPLLFMKDIPTKSGSPLLFMKDIPTKFGLPLLFMKDIPTKSGLPTLQIKYMPTKSGSPILQNKFMPTIYDCRSEKIKILLYTTDKQVSVLTAFILKHHGAIF